MPPPSCHAPLRSEGLGDVRPSRPVARPASAVMLGFLVAFFPKCPMCWATYMSALGFAGFAQIPYPEFLFPVLVALLGLHLFLAWRQVAHVGLGPPLVTFAGMLTVLLVRWLDAEAPWAPYAGLVLLLGGALWHSLALYRRSLRGAPPPVLPTA